MSSKIKVYELAKELGQESQVLVDAIQRLGIDIKNPMSVLGSEEVRSVREYFHKQRSIKDVGKLPLPSKGSVTEKRVGATLIRRRAKSPSVTEKSEEISDATETEIDARFQAALSNEPEEVSVQGGAPVEDSEKPEGVKSSKVASTLPEVDKKGRRVVHSIIKKVATEKYLGEKVGPKPTQPKKEEAAGVAATETKAPPKRVKEIELVPSEAAKDVKRKVVQRQDSVFRQADYLKRELVHSAKKKKAALARPVLKTQITTPREHKRVVEMGDSITVSELARELGLKATKVVQKLMDLGVAAEINDGIDHDTAVLCAHEFGYEVKSKVFREESFLPPVNTAVEHLKPRPPVVTIMGHVDHGKTSLLDAIRKTNVAAREAGGITQHVGAYTVHVPKGKISFVDTPGHEAFTAMRARGAKVTDIVVLVVSAVDGVMPQTLESVAHAKAAEVPIIVAVNKIDLPDGNPERIKQTLAGHGLNPEEWGGDTIYSQVSAKTGKGIEQLLESILLQAEILELKANFDCPARGTVIESRLDKNKGAVASVLVQHGVLKQGETIVCGSVLGKVRAMNDSNGQKIVEATPGDPVEILGLAEVPNVGDTLAVVPDEKTGREITVARVGIVKGKTQELRPKMTVEELLQGTIDEKECRLIVKADVQGSAEAIRDALTQFPQDKVKLKLLHVGTGGVTESDVMLASASSAFVIGFNVRPDLKAQKTAEAEKVTLRTYTIIYDLLEDIKKLLVGLLDASIREKVIGRAEVRSVFNIPKIGAVAGSAVLDGKVVRGCFLRLLRDSRVIYEGKISSLRRFKEDVKEVQSGFECGIGLENFNDVKLGDQFEAFVKEEVKATLL